MVTYYVEKKAITCSPTFRHLLNNKIILSTDRVVEAIRVSVRAGK